jgi:hypothetical protein
MVTTIRGGPKTKNEKGIFVRRGWAVPMRALI